ncbi:MAG: type 4a pilus biogenesis protein PilO [Nitrospirae bacterium]|nr:type 4a pilus biogenesis protein PilO [Nitrospirota bacterium]
MRKLSPAFITVISLIAVSGILFAFYVRSELNTIRTLNAAVAQMDAGNEFTASGVEKDIALLKELFPRSGSTAEFIEGAYVISSKYAIDDIEFNYKDRAFVSLDTGKVLKALPTSGIMPGIIYRDSVKINFTSDYRSIAEFIRELQNLNRLVKIEGLKVQNLKTSLAVEMVVNIYSAEEINAL